MFKDKSQEEPKILDVDALIRDTPKRRGSKVTVSIAFEIIIHHFSGNTVPRSKQEIVDRVLDVHEEQGGSREFAVKDPVNKVLHYLKTFGQFFLSTSSPLLLPTKPPHDLCIETNELVTEFVATQKQIFLIWNSDHLRSLRGS